MKLFPSVICLWLSLSAFAAEHVRFKLPEPVSLAFVQALGAAKIPGVVWSATADQWKSATCDAFLFRPGRDDKELTLHDVDNRIECQGGAGQQLVYPLADTGVQFWGNFATHHSSTLVGGQAPMLAKALKAGLDGKLGEGRFEPFDFCSEGYCLDATELLTEASKWTGSDWVYGRIVLTCTSYVKSDKVYKSDCYLIDVAE